eukprot:218184_1
MTTTSIVLFAIFTNIIFVYSIQDWLLYPPEVFPTVTFNKAKINGLDSYILSNGLISRQFIISPNFGTVSYDSYISNSKSSILRALSPEAIIGINNINYNIGGINFKNTSITNSASPNTAYIDPTWITANNLYTNTSNTFTFNNNITITPIWTPYQWKPGNRHAPTYLKWPPLGIGVQIEFICNSNNIKTLPSYICSNIKIYVRYEMYQGLPLLSKSIIIQSSNPTITSNITLTKLAPDTLKVNVPYSPGSNHDAIEGCSVYDMGPDSSSNMITYSGGLYLETDQAHGTHILWSNDINMNNIWGSYQPNVIIEYAPADAKSGWAARLAPDLPGTINGYMRSFRVFELVLDITPNKLGDMERSGLARRRMLRTLSPATMENPIFAATVQSSPFTSNASLYSFIDQCNTTGFELLIFSFGSGFNMETKSAKEISYYENIIKYANSKGVEIGGYDLIMEDRSYGNGEYAVIGSDGKNENDLCFASNWVPMVTNWFDDYINIGMKNIITDGPYGGQACYSTKHTFHYDSGDSIFRQEYLQNEFFINIKNKGVYIHQPDNYYYFGGSKSAMGYNENQYSLPRWLQLSVSRMGMYDDTFVHTVTQGWMFLPLTAYHSNNADCYFEPLSQHIDEYNWALGQYFGYGVMAMMRGKELYDTQQVKNIVIKWTSFYNKHRQVLIGDIIHLRRCDMQWFDAILHVSPFNDNGEQGLAMIYNPTNNTINTNYTFSLYYTGIKNNAMVSYNDDTFTQYKLNDIYDVTLTLSLSPVSINYYVFKQS